MPSDNVAYPSVEWVLLQGDRCRNYGPEHTRVENENVIVILADEVVRLHELLRISEAKSIRPVETTAKHQGWCASINPDPCNCGIATKGASAWCPHYDLPIVNQPGCPDCAYEKTTGQWDPRAAAVKQDPHCATCKCFSEEPSPDQLMGALQDRVHKEIGITRPAHAVKAAGESRAEFERDRGFVRRCLKCGEELGPDGHHTHDDVPDLL